MELVQIAIDGPAGAGKSTIAKRVASQLNILHLDTGAMYRAIGLYILDKKIDTNNESDIDTALSELDINVRYIDNKQITLLNEIDVNSQIRTSEVSKAASDVSKFTCVRKKLVSIQQKIASSIPIVMDGRDIGTYVLPNAKYKFFLTASVKQRAKRRYLEIIADNENTIFDDVKKEIKERDFQDTHREFAPLKKANDAIEIDTTYLSIEEVLKKVYEDIGIKDEVN